MKSLFFGILLIIVIGIGGFVYRNAIEYPKQPIACPQDARVCPDGTSIARTGTSCTFLECPLPNITLSDVGIAFAIPEGFINVETPDSSSIVAYETSNASSTEPSSIVIRRYSIDASSTPLATIKETAIGDASGEPVSVNLYSSKLIGNHQFTIVPIGRFEGVIDTAYYLARSTDVLRFDAIDRGADWTNPNLDTASLPAHSALIKLLTTLQGQ